MIRNSIIIPFHSNANLLSMCVESLYKVVDFDDTEIIIVDNNANGSQIPSSLRLHQKCRILTKNANLMYPQAINLGAENAKGKYLVFCDADTYPQKGFYHALTAALKEDGVGYAAAKLLNMHTNALLEFGITSSYYNFPHPFTGRHYDFELVKNNHYPLAACAACSAIEKDLFLSIGGFDKELIHSYSDIDLCLRLKERGYSTICVTDAFAYHYGSSTIDSGMSASLKEDTKGIFMKKHPNIPVQILYYVDMACRYFLETHKIRTKDYCILDCSTIANSALYLDRVTDNLDLNETLRYRLPYRQRDALYIDYINFIPYSIRNYRVPLLYFVDSFQSFRENNLWKSCRADFDDLVVDRHANIELLRNV